MAKGDPYVPPNPWVFQTFDRNGLPFSITIPWNAGNRNITGGTVYRSPGCQVSTIMIGLGPDGTPNTSENAYTVPEGSTDFAANVLRANGLNTIDDVVALQITAA